MKNIGRIMLIGISLIAPFAGFSQTPPPNDNFANRTPLAGADITFTGNLAGATLESTNETEVFFNGTFFAEVAFPTQSVWWTWSASTTTVYFEIIGCSTNQAFGDLIAVYQANNSAATASNIYPPAAMMVMDPTMLAQTLSMTVVAGADYQIQLLGSSSASYTIRLLATNAPMINQQPRSQTVFSNASALFYVAASGLTSLAYQWRLGTNDLPGETAPLLAFTNIEAGVAGDYSVVISNASGAITSAPATLAISQSKALAVLQAAGIRSNVFWFNLTGENGRSYRIESSTNLIDWSPAPSFPISRVNPTGASVAWYAGSPLALAVTNSSARKFFRAVPYAAADPDAELCINNLRKIQAAKILWHRDNNEPISAWPADFELLPYFPHAVYPFCPLDPAQMIDASHDLMPLPKEPVCMVEPLTHRLEEAP